MPEQQPSLIKNLFDTTILVSALGYFVVIYDLILFGIIRIPRLKDLGIIWDVLGDKKGRLYVLFGSIFLYSVAKLINAFVKAIDYWAVFVTTASEQFGTNLRSTVTTTLPNFIRGMVVPITLPFEFFRECME